MNEKTLNLYPIDYPFETLVSRLNAESPKLILNPDFQRKFKWDKEGWVRASKFIESCLMRIPLPSCYFAEDQDGKHLVIDGVQRITTISKFMNDEFKLEGLTTFEELEGKKFSELGAYKQELEATTIRCIILRKENDQRLIREIFSRLNQGAVSLSEQEIRHALYHGAFDELLTRLSNTPIIKNFGKGPSSTSKNDDREGEEQVLRFFALQSSLEDYGNKLGPYLDRFMQSQAGITLTECEEYEKQFNKSLKNCITVFGKENVFKDMSKQQPKQSMVYYDLLMPSMGLLSNSEAKEKRTKIIQAFQDLCNSAEFQKTLSGGLQKKSSMLKRRTIWEKLLSKNLK